MNTYGNWLLSLLCFALLACGNVKLEKESSLSNGGFTDVTDLSSCRGSTPSRTSLFNTQWRLDLLQPETNISYRQIVKFESGAVSMALTCTSGSTQTTVQVRSSASIVSTQINILTSDTAEAFFNVNGELTSCKAEMKAGTVMAFQFEGPCLRLQEGGQVRKLVPTIAIP